MKIGLFFGSFNPVHAGHLVIANYFAEFSDLDKVWFVVSPHNPHKAKESLLQGNHRLAMVREAIADYPKFKASDIEFSMPQPSYTVDTLTYLKEKYPDVNFVLIMGSDNLESFHKWKNHTVIAKEHAIYIYPRPGYVASKYEKEYSIKVVPAPVMEISSTMIRKAIRDKKDVRYFLNEKVWQYIKEMHFYEK